MRDFLKILLAALVMVACLGAPAQARQANIHIHGTAPEGYVNIRPAPSTAGTPLGRIPEGASPDFECYAYGEMVVNVRVWFLVTYNGVHGWYASYYDDSSYASEDDLAARYAIPKCGAPSTSTPTPPPPTPTPTASGSVFYAGDPPADGYDLVSSATTRRRKSQWYASGCKATSRNPAASYGDTIDGRKVTTLAGFSSGRLGVLYYLRTSPSRGANVTRIVLFDPGNKSDLTGGCDDRASQTLASWLRRVPGARLIILAGKRTAEKRHQGIQDMYFAPAIRGTSLAKQVIVCNLDGWDHTDVVKGYQHFVGSPPDACPHEYVQWSP